MHESQATRASLLVRIQDAGDRRAWEQFVQIYSPLVYRYARRRGLQDADAADVTQDVMRTVAKTIGAFDYDPDRGRFRSWLMTVARTRLADHVNAQNRQPQGSGDTAEARILEEQSSTDDEEFWEREHRKCLFDWAVKQIQDEFQTTTWQAFWRTSVDGEETKAVAAELEMSVGAVYIARSRVLARLRQKVGELEDGR